MAEYFTFIRVNIKLMDAKKWKLRSHLYAAFLFDK